METSLAARKYHFSYLKLRITFYPMSVYFEFTEMLDVNKDLLNIITRISKFEKHNLWTYMYTLILERQ